MFSLYYFENDWNDFFMWRWSFFLCENGVYSCKDSAFNVKVVFFIWKWRFSIQKVYVLFVTVRSAFIFMWRWSFIRGKVMLFCEEDGAFSYQGSSSCECEGAWLLHIKCCYNDKIKSFETTHNLFEHREVWQILHLLIY